MGLEGDVSPTVGGVGGALAPGGGFAASILATAIVSQVEKVKAFEEAFLQELRKNNKKLLAELKSGKISDKETDEIKKVAEKVAKSF